jgi:hypothetical protein
LLFFVDINNIKMFNNSGFVGYNNNLLRNRHKYSNNIPFQNNQLLMNNPNYIASINNHNFQQKLYMAKMEQLNRAKKVQNMNVSEDELYKYVINPIKVEKISEGELNREFNERQQNYLVEYDKNKKYMGNKTVREWWKKRTNQPYKNILKKENYKKKFKNKSDLIVHKVTDEDKIGLMEELKNLEDILEEHNNQLSLIYSKSEKLKHKKKFQYNNIYKYRLKHDVKDYNELKEIYKKEQKKIEKEDRRIDNMINHLMDADILNNDQKQLLQKQLQDLDQKTITDSETESLKIKKKIKETTEVLKIKKVVKKEQKSNTKSNILKIKTVSKTSTTNTTNSNSTTNNSIKIKTIKVNLKDENKIGEIDDATFKKYMNRSNKD